MRLHIMRKLPLSSVVVLAKLRNRIQGPTFSIGVIQGFEVAREEDVGSPLYVGCHEDKERKHASAIVPQGFCKLICMIISKASLPL